VSDAKGQVQASAEFVRTYDAQTREITNAITAMLINAQAGLDLLRAQSPDLEEVRQVLNCIANDSQRAGDIVFRTRSLVKKVAAAGGAE
jgi:predicted lactoylglutathione lyase